MKLLTRAATLRLRLLNDVTALLDGYNARCFDATAHLHGPAVYEMEATVQVVSHYVMNLDK